MLKPLESRSVVSEARFAKFLPPLWAVWIKPRCSLVALFVDLVDLFNASSKREIELEYSFCKDYLKCLAILLSQ